MLMVPFGRQHRMMSGVELQANIADALLQGIVLRPAADAWSAAFAAAAAILHALLYELTGALWLAFAGAAGLVVVAALWAMAAFGLWLPPSAACAGLILGLAVQALLRLKSAPDRPALAEPTGGCRAEVDRRRRHRHRRLRNHRLHEPGGRADDRLPVQRGGRPPAPLDPAPSGRSGREGGRRRPRDQERGCRREQHRRGGAQNQRRRFPLGQGNHRQRRRRRQVRRRSRPGAERRHRCAQPGALDPVPGHPRPVDLAAEPQAVRAGRRARARRSQGRGQVRHGHARGIRLPCRHRRGARAASRQRRSADGGRPPCRLRPQAGHGRAHRRAFLRAALPGARARRVRDLPCAKDQEDA